MINIESLLASLSAEDARSVIYYVSRYVKQARHFRDFHKDIFEDVGKSAPTEEVKARALLVISAIEGDQARKATEFSTEEIMDILRELTAFESKLNGDLSAEELRNAAAILANLDDS